MAIVSYKRSHTTTDGSFIGHLASKTHVKILALTSWLLLLFAFALNISVHLFYQAPRAVVAQDVKQDSQGEVAGAATVKVQPTNVPTPYVSPTPEQKVPRKKAYKIAIIGDSMVDTMGNRLEYLEHALKKEYPQTKFDLYNYGIGSQNVEEGLARFGKPFQNTDRSFPPLNALGADIIIVGSFAYNPFTPYDRDRHWLGLAKLVEETKKTKADVYLLAEIAPLRFDFGKGTHGVNYDSTTAYEHSGEIIEQLENAVGLSKNLNVLLINAFEKSITNERSEGKKEFVDPNDGIHPSVAGHEFIADEIVKTLVLN